MYKAPHIRSKLKLSFGRIPVTSLLIALAVTALAGLVYFYVFLPPISIYSTKFWIMIIVLAVIFMVVSSIISKKTAYEKGEHFESNSIPLIIAGIALAVIIIGGIFSSTFFNAKKYAAVINVTESDFATDMPQTSSVTNIALMDTASAKVLGNRTLGSLSDVVSQYELNTEYTQINFQRTPQKVATLEYAGFFKWLGNRSKGIPGYVMVDPVNNSAKYMEFSTPMKYAASGYFNDSLIRKIRFSYPTKIFSEKDISFEVDDEGNPWYIVSCYKPYVGLFGAMDINEVIMFNPCDGSSTLYKLEDVPAWVDIVFDGTLACEKYDWQGLYSGGFWNSIIGNVGCKLTTDDFGYIVIEDDVWYFTGVTSVNSDKSNIGFIISNARTGEYKFYPVIGAEEYSAMSAAQGEVQEKGYIASFPSLINVSGNATYIMVLKDDAGLVKLYALVNVENYGIVATGNSQSEAISEYRKLLFKNGLLSSDEPDTGNDKKELETTVIAENIRIVDMNGTPVVYITANDGNVYKGDLEKDESLILIKNGDSITLVYTETDIEKIYTILSWK